MRLSRIFIDLPFAVGQTINTSVETTHYLNHVLRLRPGESLILFNGQGGEYTASVVTYTKKTAVLIITQFHPLERESSLRLTLVQAISRPEHMDYTVQKAVELGVNTLVPVVTKRSPPLDKSRLHHRFQHWHKIILSACEQCGRNQIPTLQPIVTLNEWLATEQQGICLVLAPEGKNRLGDIPATQSFSLLVGAEGGFTDGELAQVQAAGYCAIQLGQRILRTETAALAVLAIFQALYGDFS